MFYISVTSILTEIVLIREIYGTACPCGLLYCCKQRSRDIA